MTEEERLIIEYVRDHAEEGDKNPWNILYNLRLMKYDDFCNSINNNTERDLNSILWKVDDRDMYFTLTKYMPDIFPDIANKQYFKVDPKKFDTVYGKFEEECPDDFEYFEYFCLEYGLYKNKLERSLAFLDVAKRPYSLSVDAMLIQFWTMMGEGVREGETGEDVRRRFEQSRAAFEQKLDTIT